MAKRKKKSDKKKQGPKPESLPESTNEPEGTLEAPDLEAMLDGLAEQESAPADNVLSNDEEQGAGPVPTGGTLDLSEIAPEAGSPEAEGASGEEADVTLEAQSLSDEGFSEGEQPGGDEAFGTAETILLPEDQAEDGVEGTSVYDSQDLKRLSGSDFGSEERLERSWMAALGSSKDVMHSVKIDQPLASASVFEKVAVRELVTDTAAAIANHPRASKDAEDKQRLEACLEQVCKGADKSTADYNLTGFLGKGAMGVVLKAWQTAIGREVALKILQPSVDGAVENTLVQKQKFFYEASITGRLDHPNIVPVYEMGESNGIVFYSMKLIKGQEWRTLIKEQTADEKLATWMKVADAMAFAHERRIIHRDLKPENIMIGAFGEVLVTDWGLAVDLDRDRSKISAGGSLAWMAPEMARRKHKALGPASDIYLLGAVLYQTVTGYPPHRSFRGAAYNVIAETDSDDPLLDIAMRAMETDPRNRYASVGEMQEAVREYQLHSESIKLSERSASILDEAESSKDYAMFAQSTFGFKDALNLWPENKAAQAGLTRAQQSHGQCALERGDYDLCLETVDRETEEGADVYNKASLAKLAAKQRESRLRTTRWALAGLVAASFIGLCGFLYQLDQNKQEIEQSNLDLKATQVELEQKNTALTSTTEELEKKNIALTSTTEKLEKNNIALTSTKLELEQRNLALTDAKEQLEQDAIIKQQQLADITRQKDELDKQNRLITEQKDEIVEKSSKAQFADYRSTLGLALANVTKAETAKALETLTKRSENLAANIQAFTRGTTERVPRFENWAWNRIKLLSNQSLVADKLAADVINVASAVFAKNSNIGAVATENQSGWQIQLVELKGDRIEPKGTPQPVASEVHGLAISPAGDELVYSLASNEGSTVYRWILDGNRPPKAFPALPEDVRQGAQNDTRPQTLQRELQRITMSSKNVVGGINGGIWVWRRSSGAEPDATPKQIRSLRGRLQSLQLIDDRYALALSKVVGQPPVVSFIDLDAPEDTLPPSLDWTTGATADFELNDLTAVAFSGNKLLLGTTEGRLFAAEATPGSSEVGKILEIGPQMHRSPIKSILAHQSDRTILTIAAEPAVQVWKRAPTAAGWAHYTYLAGTPSNVSTVSFAGGSSSVVGIGETGHPIVWNIERQKQYRQLVPLDETGDPLKSPSPVIDIVISGDNQRAVSIHENSMLSVWNPRNGRIVLSNDSEFGYIGHLPGASFVDMAIDQEAAVMITAVRLPFNSEIDASEGEQEYQFCKWNLKTGKMLDRWEESRSSRAFVSLLDQGRLISYSSFKEAVLREADRDGQVVLDYSKAIGAKTGMMYALENPRAPEQVLSVARNGAVRVLDRTTLQPLDVNLKLLSKKDEVLGCAWAESGDRFYLLWREGRVVEMGWNGSKLSTEPLNSSQINRMPRDIHHRLEIKIRQEDGHNIVYIPDDSASAPLLTKVKFPIGGGIPEARTFAIDSDPAALQGRSLVVSDSAQPTWLSYSLNKLPGVDRNVITTRQIGQNTYIATESGNVYRFSDDGQVVTFGAPPVLAAAGDGSASRIITLREGGILWRADWDENQWNWTQLEAVGPSADDVAMSPDGKQILLSSTEPDGQRRTQMLDGETGLPLPSMEEAICGSWNRQGDLLMVTQDSSIYLRKAGAEQSERIGMLHESTSAATTLSIQFFTEAWRDGNTTEWVLVFARNADGIGTLEYHPLPAGDAVEAAQQPLASSVPFEIGSATAVACSPIEGIIATGNKDSVTVRFATPSLNEYGDEVYSLEGHGGADISALQFSSDGSTLISSDNQNRVLGWLSQEFPAAKPAVPAPENSLSSAP